MQKVQSYEFFDSSKAWEEVPHLGHRLCRRHRVSRVGRCSRLLPSLRCTRKTNRRSVKNFERKKLTLSQSKIEAEGMTFTFVKTSKSTNKVNGVKY